MSTLGDQFNELDRTAQAIMGAFFTAGFFLGIVVGIVATVVVFGICAGVTWR